MRMSSAEAVLWKSLGQLLTSFSLPLYVFLSTVQSPPCGGMNDEGRHGGKVCMCVLEGEQRSVRSVHDLDFQLYFRILVVGGDGGEAENRKHCLPSVIFWWTSAAGDGGEADSRKRRLLLLLEVPGCFTPLCLQRATETFVGTRAERRALQPAGTS